jgi:hypothetical protein
MSNDTTALPPCSLTTAQVAPVADDMDLGVVLVALCQADRTGVGPASDAHCYQPVE